MKTAMVLIIKNITGYTSDKNNYRPVALVTTASKLFEVGILEVLETYLLTHDHQFGFKYKHSTDMYSFTVKSLIKYCSGQLTNKLIACNAVCYFNSMRINHVMCADDICLLAPTASAMQSLLDVCYEYGTDNDILFNPPKSIFTVFKPKGYKLYLPTVSVGQEALKYVSEYKYLGFSFSDSKCDDCDMLRQMRSLYAK